MYASNATAAIIDSKVGDLLPYFFIPVVPLPAALARLPHQE